ncbi:MAG: YARHG domain-containing protein [Calditrichaeota bacterium]|nr:YARHG domain-containing protein [Calditrichota bacterium]MCB0289145.1 YARHG domain-containing protein [Calditrichota bacterium]MCB0296139.1 YARHG domain-containing protein [Calditrichota bacterium]MCB0302191.1 YARHG domain-containing protein [Calditrichota bacterium]MCB0311949.1 YARHG domain-containing protein [Calditrichota bacterium]
MKKFIHTLLLLTIFPVSLVLSQDYEPGIGDSLETFLKDFTLKPQNRLFRESQTMRKILGVMNNKELRIFRNAFFARAGYEFNDQDMQSFFERFDWYTPKTKEIVLNESDKLNIQFIKSLEATEKQRFEDFLSLFITKELPIRISKENCIIPFHAKIGIDRKLVVRYLYFTKKLHDRLTMNLPSEAGHYFALCKIIRPSFIIVCYLNELAAGGYLHNYYLATFTTQGELISKERIAFDSGEALSIKQSNILISADLEIQVENILIRLNESEEEESRQVMERIYLINDQGKIELLSS